MKDQMETRQVVQVGRPLAISARELAQMLRVSLRQVWRLNSAGKLPEPIRLGGSVRWKREEIMNWFNAGCPDRRIWESGRAVRQSQSVQ